MSTSKRLRFLDPTRPRINSSPAYPPERPIAALFSLNIYPRDEETILVTCWPMTAPNNASTRQIFIKKEELASLWERWLESPETVLEELFSWEPPRGGRRPHGVSLSDLGL